MSFIYLFIFTVPTVDLVFTTTADSTTTTEIFNIMQQTVQAISDKYGSRKVRISLVTFGTPPVVVFDFNTTIPDKESLAKELAKVTKLSSNPDLQAAIKKAEEIFDYSPVRPDSKKVLTVITHRKFNLGETDIRNAVKPLDDKGVRIVTVGLGSAPEQSELTNLTRTERAVIRPVSNDGGKQVADEILKVILNGEYRHCIVLVKQLLLNSNLYGLVYICFEALRSVSWHEMIHEQSTESPSVLSIQSPSVAKDFPAMEKHMSQTFCPSF